jgi:polyphosphate kinase
MPGIKVHSKLALITRKEHRKSVLYAYLGTGNFNEDTARVYSDFSLFTANEKLTKEVACVFNYLETSRKEKEKFEHLLVGQFNLRSGLVKKIDREIDNAKAGKAASMVLKMNSLEDHEMIEKLYEASQAGVKIKVIVRGICCLVPQVKGLSENIDIISIVDRYLEHARVFIFHNEGDEEIYLSSADFMERNLSNRVETAFPIYDSQLKSMVKDMIDLQLRDNVKARVIDANLSNQYAKNEDDIAVRAQLETYFYFKRNENTYDIEEKHDEIPTRKKVKKEKIKKKSLIGAYNDTI